MNLYYEKELLTSLLLDIIDNNFTVTRCSLTKFTSHITDLMLVIQQQKL